MEEESPLRSKFLHILFFLMNSPAYAGEFLYPVAVDAHQSCVYLVYQKSPQHIELWGWDPISRRAQQMLFSRITPAGFKLLPDGNGFSFIDQGQLKIKSFIKRSPRTIEFEIPLYNMELVHWIDHCSCYTHAKYNGRFGLFYLTLDGEVCPLRMPEAIDCVYPQKQGDTLFYIERDERWQYRIMKMAFKLPPELESFQERRAWYEEHGIEAELVLDFGQRPIVFLNMVSEGEGFVVEHDRAMSKRDQTVKLSYHRIVKEEDGWRSERLFGFSILSRFLFLGKQDRLYEAFLPLLPRHMGQHIYFVDAIDRDLGVFQYDRISGDCTVVMAQPGQSLFVPICWGNRLLLGGSLGNQISMESIDWGVKTSLAEFPFYVGFYKLT